MADKGERTEQPTPRRLDKARRDGRFPVSREFVASLQFLAFVFVLAYRGGGWGTEFGETTRFLLARAFDPGFGPADLMRLLEVIYSRTLAPLGLLGAILLGVALAAQLATTRFGFAAKKLAPDFKRLNFLRRLRDLPRQNVPLFFQSLLLLPMFAVALWLVVKNDLEAIYRLPLQGAAAGARQLGFSAVNLFWKAAGVFLLLGVLDFWRQRRRYTAELRMSKQEIREELKEAEGNPQVRNRIRRLQRDLIRRRMMQEVPKATAVIVNPTHYAVAIRYHVEDMSAPRVLAKGRNYMALRIRQKAVTHQVPIIENAPLAQALYKSTRVGQEIPPHLYRAVAEILAYIYRIMNGRLPG